jgi:dihydropteroate synthase
MQKSGDKSTIFSTNSCLQCGDKSLNLHTPVVMGIINLTPDSFYEGSRYQIPSEVLKTAEKMIEDGARILDLGAVSTRPGALEVSPDEEAERLIPMVKLIHKYFPQVIISVDTYRASIAHQSVLEGAGIVNDISGGTMDTAMFTTLAKLDAAYILMHIKGTPETMQVDPLYEKDDVTGEVYSFFKERLGILKENGFTNIILDPGFGFGKTIRHNYRLIYEFDRLRDFGLPLLAGISRKSMIYKPLDTIPENALNGTTVLNTLCLLKGVQILRVHDVKEAAEAIKIVQLFRNEGI